MSIDVLQGGAWRNVRTMHVKSNGSWVPVSRAYVREEGVWKPFYGDLIVTASPSSASAISDPGFTAVTNPVTVSVQNSVGSLTYLWERVSGAPEISINAPNSQSTTFSGVPSNSPSGFYNANFRCAVTDDILGQTSYSQVVPVSIIAREID